MKTPAVPLLVLLTGCSLLEASQARQALEEARNLPVGGEVRRAALCTDGSLPVIRDAARAEPEGEPAGLLRLALSQALLCHHDSGQPPPAELQGLLRGEPDPGVRERILWGWQTSGDPDLTHALAIMALEVNPPEIAGWASILGGPLLSVETAEEASALEAERALWCADIAPRLYDKRIQPGKRGTGLTLALDSPDHVARAVILHRCGDLSLAVWRESWQHTETQIALYDRVLADGLASGGDVFDATIRAEASEDGLSPRTEALLDELLADGGSPLTVEQWQGSIGLYQAGLWHAMLAASRHNPTFGQALLVDFFSRPFPCSALASMASALKAAEDRDDWLGAVGDEIGLRERLWEESDRCPATIGGLWYAPFRPSANLETGKPLSDWMGAERLEVLYRRVNQADPYWDAPTKSR